MACIISVSDKILSKILTKDCMTCKSLLIIVLLTASIVIFSGNISANDISSPDQYRFFYKYNLSGVPELINNRVVIYRVPEGLSRYHLTSYHIPGLQPETYLDFDYEERRVFLTPKLTPKIELYYPIELTFDNYLQKSFRGIFRAKLFEKMQALEEERRTDQTGLIPDIVIDLPALPRSVRRFIGDRPSRLSLTGSQRLTFSGSSTKRDNQLVTETGTASTFSLEMRQDLNLQLRGTIGEKIHVNVSHRSASEMGFGDPSTIEIEYVGDEDEVVQSIKGGNISLALSGSEFIRYSASSSGLFGIRGDFKLGDLEFTAIASKEESERNVRKFTGTDAADSLQYRSRDFVNRTHYYVVNPYDLFALYEEDMEGEQLRAGYANNAIQTTLDGSWIVANPGLLPEDTQSLIVYLDRGQASYTENWVEGWEIGEDPETIDPYRFEILEVNADYNYDEGLGLLTMNMPVDRRFTIGITYARSDGVQVGNPNENALRVKIIKRSNQTTQDTDTWPLQVRNMYNLNSTNIQNEGFRLNFFTIDPDGTYNYFVDEEIGEGGLYYNDYLRLDTSGDNVIDGNDRTVDLELGLIYLPFIEPFRAFSDGIIYDQETFNSTDLEQINIYMSVVGRVGRDKIELGQINILPGSVRVVVDGETLEENVHYLVDYDFGHISFLGPKGKNPDSTIEINYENRPLFAIESKTLMGLRADWNLSDHTKIGGTFIYHSEKVSDRRPTIGNENRTLLMADIDGRVEFDPPFLTKLVDLIPLIRTDADSRVSLSGEVAMTLPRHFGHKDQHDRKEAYLDDMEAIVDSYPLGLSRLNWSPASKPVNVGSVRARANWYNPDNVYAEEVYSPEFLTLKERREKVQVLTLRAIPPSISSPGITNQYWGGIMRYLGNNIDFSEKKYIEVLVRIDKYPFQSNDPSVTLHIDLGDVSEDFYVWNGGEGVLNTEDGAMEGDVDGVLQREEDVGLDRIPEGEEGDDPWDSFSNDKDAFGDYPYINGTSGNSLLDTEDLNGNLKLDTLNRYFQYKINLHSMDYESEHEGWRLYRIPIDDYVVKTEGTQPTLRRISFARVWLEVEELTRVQIAKMNVVGNRWQEGFVKNTDDEVISPVELDNNNESMVVGVVDNQNNRDHYVSPPNTTVIDDGVPLLEQSLTIDYTNLQKDHYGLVVRRYREAQNLMSYGKLRYWVYLERERDDETEIPKGDQEIIFRAGADSLNYYEIRYPVKAQNYHGDGNKMLQSNWREVEINFSDLNSLKQFVMSSGDIYESTMPITVNGESDTLHVKVRGNRVTLTNVREMAVGVVNRGERSFNGRAYINDIRVADPYEDIGFAARTTLNTTFADFSTLNVGLVWRSENFNTNTTRARSPRTNIEETVSLDITNRYNIEKFLPAEWGFKIPLTLIRNQSYGIPRYKANSDILRADIEDPVEREREKRETLVRSAEVSINQTVTPQSNWLKYTVRNTSFRGNIRMNQNVTSTSADTTLIYSGNVGYNLALPKENLGVRLGQNYSLYFFPHTFNNSVSYRAEFPQRWRWDTNLPDTLAVKWTPERYSEDKKDLDLSTTINYDPTTDLTGTFSFSQKRDLTREHQLWGKVPFGKEKERDQNISLNYSPQYLRQIFTFSSTASVRYREMQKSIQQGQQQLPDDEDVIYEFEGNVSRNIRFNLTLKNREMLTGLMNKYGIRQRELPKTEYVDPAYPGDDRKDWDGSGFDDKGMDPFAFSDPEKDPFNDPFADPDKGYDDQRRTEDERKRLEEERKRIEEQRRKEIPEEEKKDLEVQEKDKEPDEGETETVAEQRLWAKALSLIARLDNITGTYENTYGSRYSKQSERAVFLYQIGLPGQIDDEREYLDMKNNRDSFTLATGYPVFQNLTTQWNYSHSIDRRYSTASQKEVTTVFPNVRVTLSGFERIIRAERFMTSSRLTSNYTHTRRVRGTIDWDQPHWDSPIGEQKSFNFSPLISWQTSWINDITSMIAYNFSQSENVTFRETFSTVQRSVNNSINMNISYTFRSPQGIKLPFFSTRMPVTNELLTELGATWEQSKSSNQGQQDTIVDRDTVRYVITPRITYNFSRNIKGGLQSSYENNHDKRRNDRIRTFSLSIWAEVQF
jgi:hypothetical protein